MFRSWLVAYSAAWSKCYVRFCCFYQFHCPNDKPMLVALGGGQLQGPWRGWDFCMGCMGPWTAYNRMGTMWENKCGKPKDKFQRGPSLELYYFLLLVLWNESLLALVSLSLLWDSDNWIPLSAGNIPGLVETQGRDQCMRGIEQVGWGNGMMGQSE